MQLKKSADSSGRFKCSKCGNWKPPTEFNKNKQQTSGLHYSCRDCSRVHVRSYNLPAKYGISATEYAERILGQGGKCACCGMRFEADGAKMNKPCVDHNHKTGEIRDVICGRCNIAAGNLLDSHEMADKVSTYLKRWNC